MLTAKRPFGSAKFLPLVLGACVACNWHTSDAKLERNFMKHEVEFNALLAQVNADVRLGMLRSDSLSYANHLFEKPIEMSKVEGAGLSKERLDWYQQQMQNLGISQINRGDSEIGLRVDQGSISNGDSYKGYRYSTTPPKGRTLTSLDGYKLSPQDMVPGGYIVYKPIKGNWYLYLFVNN